MKKRAICLFLALTLLVSLCPTAFAATSKSKSKTTYVDIVVDGVYLEGYQGKRTGETTVVSVAILSLAIRPDAVFTMGKTELTVCGGDFVLSAKIGRKYIEVNGRPLYLAEGVGVDELGGPTVPIDLLAKALGAAVEWDGRVVITTGGTPLESADTYYDQTDLDLISRVIMHESGNQSLEGKIAVGNVILNRVNDKGKSFPNTVYDVLMQKNQFPNATKVSSVSKECLVAAKLAMDGVMIVPGACWFNRKGLKCWASRNKKLIATIGAHDFYG